MSVVTAHMVYFCAFARSEILLENARKSGVGRGEFDAGVNGLKTFHGTQIIQFQIISAVSIAKKLPELRRMFLPEDGPVTDFYQNMVSSYKFSNGINLSEG